MLVLLIQSFDTDRSHGRQCEAAMKSIVERLFHQFGELDVRFMQRDFDQLGDIVVDWEHDQLHHSAEEHCLKFDSIDLVVITGDLSVLPWEPRAMQLVSLIHMAKFAQKPLIGIGFGAFSAIYSIASKGSRFNVLNGPQGDVISELPSFPRYSIGSGAFPSGWLDKETGDVYTFQRKSQLWRPVCNLGVHSVALRRESVFDNIATQPRPQHLREDFQSVAPSQQMSVTKKSDGSVLHVVPRYVQHQSLRHLPSNHFSVKVFHGWRLNRDGGLPPGERLLVLGEGQTGPLLLHKDRMLLVAARFDGTQETESPSILILLQTYIHDLLQAVRNCPTDKLELSMHHFLFGESLTDALGEYDTAEHRVSMAPPLARRCIPCLNTPIKTDPPVMDMFFRPPRTATDFDFATLVQQRRASTVGKRPRPCIRNPHSARGLRIAQALQAVGIESQPQMQRDAQGQSAQQTQSPRAIMQAQTLESLPESSADLLAGVAMNDSSISTRRHRGADYQRFQESMRLQQTHSKAPTQGWSQGTSEEAQSLSSQSVILSSLLLAPESDDAAPEEEVEGHTQTRRPFFAPPRNTPSATTAAADYSLQLQRYKEQLRRIQYPDAPPCAAESGDLGAVKPQADEEVRAEVCIADWLRVYSLSGAGNDLLSPRPPDSAPPSRVATAPQTPRRSQAQTPQRGEDPEPQTPKSSLHTPTVASLSARKQRPPEAAGPATPSPQRSPRGGALAEVREVLARCVRSYLPPQHPTLRRANCGDDSSDDSDDSDEDSDSAPPARDVDIVQRGVCNRERLRGLTAEGPVRPQRPRPPEPQLSAPCSQRGALPLYYAAPGTAEPAAQGSPRSNYLAMQRRFAAQDAQNLREYTGMFVPAETAPASPDRSRWLAGDFKLKFAPDRTAMALRPEGGVRAAGPYPDPPGFAVPPKCTAADFTFMKDLHPAGPSLAQMWK